MVIIYISIECENDCAEGQRVKIEKFKIMSVVTQWTKTFIILDSIWQKTFINLDEILLWLCFIN